MFAKFGDLHGVAEAFFGLGQICKLKGDFKQLREYAEISLHAGQEYNDKLEICCAIAFLADLEVIKGKVDQGLNLIRSYFGEARDNAFSRIYLSSSKMRALVKKGLYDEAILVVDRVVKEMSENRMTGYYMVEPHVIAAEVYVRSLMSSPQLSSKERKILMKKAKLFCRKSLKLVKGFTAFRAYAYCMEGLRQILLGKKEKALKYFKMSIEAAREQGCLYEEGLTLKEVAKWLEKEKMNPN